MHEAVGPSEDDAEMINEVCPKCGALVVENEPDYDGRDGCIEYD